MNYQKIRHTGIRQFQILFSKLLNIISIPQMKIQKIVPALVILTLIYPGILFSQGKGTAKIALVQATAKTESGSVYGRL